MSDLVIGRRFGRLVVTAEAGRAGAKRLVACRCDCGQSAVVRAELLRNGKTRSCGCLRREVTGRKKRSHGLSGTPEYDAWVNMHRRCYEPMCSEYHRYGGRGIAVCDRWRDVANFLADMGPRPSPEHSLDRRDSNGNYEPGNCRWATKVEQSQNSRNAALTPEIVRQLRKAKRAGRLAEVATALGIAETTAYMAASGKSWRNVV